MSRTIRDASLDNPTARRRLAPRGKPYYRMIEEGLHLGYRRLQDRAGKPISGKWVVRHYDADSKAYEVETIEAADDLSNADGVAILSFKQAQEKARARMVARAHVAAGKSGPLTVRDAVERYLDYLDKKRKSGYDARHRANALILPQLGRLECSELTKDIIHAWLEALGKSPALVRSIKGKQNYRPLSDEPEALRRRQVSANRTLTILKGALNHAWRDEKIASDAAWRRVRPFEGVDRARTRYLKIAEAQRLINASSPTFRPLVQAALATGARYGELVRLTVGDFNADSNTLLIRTSKSGKPRHIVLTEEGEALFRQLTAGRSGHELMLRNAAGDAFKPSNQALPMIEACERAKIMPPISFHALRHTYASLCIMAGVPLMVVARNLGHADTSMVEEHYGHLAASYVVDAIRTGAPRFGFEADGKVVSI